jgi:hypothetical protein
MRMLRRAISAVVALTLVAMFPPAILADVDSCREAIRQFKSARADIASAFRTYGNCVSGSDGTEDCSSEFGQLRLAQDDFESAVSSYQSDCP